MRIRKTGIALAVAVFAMSVTSAWADGLVARLNSTKVAQGDTLQLVLTAEGSAQAAPDLAPLSKDFDVLGTSQSSQTQIINGRRSQSISWIVTLSPLNQGVISIPSLSAGTLTSEPLSVEVVDASQLPKLQGADGIALSATVEDAAHYRFQEIPLTVRLESQLPLQSAQIIEPVGKFELTQSGQSRQSQFSRDGQLINVLEQSYLLRPQEEGELEISPFTLKGTVQDPDARNRDPFGSAFGGSSQFARMEQMMAQFGGGMGSMFGARGKPFVARSDALNLTIQANPAGDSSSWFLPAKQVELSGAWLSENPVFREGEAVTRRISMLALGARPEQLPDLIFEDPDGASIYVDDIRTDTVDTADGTVAQRDFIISIVPTRAGEIVLPEITLDWLDTASGESQTATLAAETITVEGVTSAASAGLNAENSEVSGSAQATDSQQDILVTDDSGASRLWWSGCAAVVIAALIALGLRRRRNSMGRQNVRSTSGVDRRGLDDAEPLSAKSLMSVLRKAAREGDTGVFYKTLLTVRQQADKCDRAVVDRAITRFEQGSYAPGTSADKPDLNGIVKSLEGCRLSTKSSGKASTKLPPLYPSMDYS